MAGLIVSSVVQKDTGVSEATIPVLIVVLAALGVVIHACRRSNMRWRSLWPFEGPRHKLGFQVIFCLLKVVLVGILPAVDLRIEFA